MKYLWKLNIDDYIEVVELAKKNGKKPGDSIEVELLEIMEKKGQKHFAATELNRNELLEEYKSKGIKALSVEVNKVGKTIYKFNKQEK